jgi:hypothetical protein
VLSLALLISDYETKPQRKRLARTGITKRSQGAFAGDPSATPRGAPLVDVFISRCGGQGASSCLNGVNGNSTSKGSATVMLG